MKISDLITPFPDEFAYRLVDVQTIKRNDKEYEAELVFQRLKESQNEDFKKLSSFFLGKLEVKTCSITYIRLFVIGSVWHNTTKVPEISYLTHYKINDSSFLKDNPEKGLIEDFFDDKIPIRRIDNNSNKTYYFNSRVVLYNLKNPLFHHKKEGKNIPLKNENPEWESSTVTKFLAFYSYEIYRYFFTCFGVCDLNQRFLTSSLTSNLVSENEIYDQSQSGYDDEKKSFLIYLKSNKDKMNTPLIGNVVSNNNFRTQMINFSNQVSLSNNPFQVFDSLPLSKFKQFSFLAKRVKKKNSDDWGLLIFKIEECKGYQEFTYQPIIHVADNSDTSSGNSGGNSSQEDSKSKENDGFKPEIKNDSSGNSNVSNGLINNDLQGLLSPNDDVEVKDPDIRKYNVNVGSGRFNQSDGGVPPEGKKKKIKVDPLDYFSFFPEIILKIKEGLSIKGFESIIAYLDPENIQQFISKPVTIDDEHCKFGYKNQKLYVVQVTIQHSMDQASYFYLFAKQQKDSIGKQGRTWLYSLDAYKSVEKNEREVKKLMDNYIYKTEKSNYKRKEPDHKFNHLTSEDDFEKGYITTDSEIAKANHVEKIVNKIIKSLETKPFRTSSLHEQNDK